MRVIYGGTFDPVHQGHVAVAEAAARELAPCALHLVPAADPPHRARPGATAEQRVAMLRLAFATHPEFLIDERELRRSGPSYMVDTLREFRAEFGDRTPLALLLGADAFLGLPSWHRWTEILELCHLVLVPRPGTSLEPLPAPLIEAGTARWTDDPSALRNAGGGLWLLLHLPLRRESATHARRSTARQQGSEAGLDPAVARFIEAAGLYQE